MKQKKEKTPLEKKQQINRGSAVAGGCFLLYLGAMALEWPAVAGAIAAIGCVIAAFTFLSAQDLRQKDKESVSYNFLWGPGALAILLGACAAAGFKLFLGL